MKMFYRTCLALLHELDAICHNLLAWVERREGNYDATHRP